jgi:hypothetical protein
MSIFLVLVLTGLMSALGTFITEGKTSAGVSLTLGYLLLSAYFIGGSFKRIGLPKLTGYIATGVVVGPSVLGLIGGAMLESTRIFNGVAIGRCGPSSAASARSASTECSARRCC